MKEMRFRILVLQLLCMILKTLVTVDHFARDEAWSICIDAENHIGAIADEMRE